MLACARIGAVHSVVFAGFSAESLRGRILDAGCKMVITANEGLRGGKRIPLKQTRSTRRSRGSTWSRRCWSSAAPTRRCRCGEGRDLWLEEETAKQRSTCPVEWMAAEDPLFTLYTSGLDRQAQGRAPHHRRLSRLRRPDPQVRLRLPPGRHLHVRRGRRLDHGPQLHPLRPARQRRDHGDVRVDPHLSGRGALLADRRRPRGQHLLHGPDRHPRHRPGRRRVGEALQPQVAAHPGHRSASRSTRRSGSGTTTWWARGAARWWTPGGRRRPAAS